MFLFSFYWKSGDYKIWRLKDLTNLSRLLSGLKIWMIWKIWKLKDLTNLSRLLSGLKIGRLVPITIGIEGFDRFDRFEDLKIWRFCTKPFPRSSWGNPKGDVKRLHRYISKALGICCDTSRARRAIVSMFAVPVVGGLLARICNPWHSVSPCHPDLPAAGRLLGGISMTELERFRPEA